MTATYILSELTLKLAKRMSKVAQVLLEESVIGKHTSKLPFYHPLFRAIYSTDLAKIII